MSMCDAGVIAVMNTTDSNTNNSGSSLPHDTVVTDSLLDPSQQRFGIAKPNLPIDGTIAPGKLRNVIADQPLRVPGEQSALE